MTMIVNKGDCFGRYFTGYIDVFVGIHVQCTSTIDFKNRGLGFGATKKIKSYVTGY